MGGIHERKDVNAVFKGFETAAGEIKDKFEDIKLHMPKFFDDMPFSEDDSKVQSNDAEIEDNNTNGSLVKEEKGENWGKVVHSSDEIFESDNPEHKTKKFLERLMEILTVSEEIKKLIEQNPDLEEKIEKCLDIINNPDKHTVAEINWAMDRIKKEIKGAIFEGAVKEALVSIDLDVEDGQRTVEGESGATRPDVIAASNTDKSIILFGKVINPGENIYIECKCGRKEYMEGQLKNHLPNQLSGHDGVSILITTSDMDEVDNNLLNNVIGKNDTTAVITGSSAEDIEDVIKEAN